MHTCACHIQCSNTDILCSNMLLQFCVVVTCTRLKTKTALYQQLSLVADFISKLASNKQCDESELVI